MANGCKNTFIFYSALPCLVELTYHWHKVLKYD